MSLKRKAAELDEDDVDVDMDLSVNPNKKNSLDSDEEDDEEIDYEKYNIMEPTDIEGEEDGEGKIEGEVLITPFNLREEMEEGHFDTTGNFIWNKKDDIKDVWLDNIDWVKIKEKPDKGPADDNEDDEEQESVDVPALYKQILLVINPGETVAKALRRLGGNRQSSAKRWSKKASSSKDETSTQDTEKLTKLTELADLILRVTGNMDIYQETYEVISFKYATPSTSSSDTKEQLDMFGDNFETEEKQRLKDPENNHKENNEVTEDHWEFKRTSADDAVIEGPHSSSQMLKWVEEGEFPEGGVLVRKAGTDGPFYSSRRIDFELYT